MIVMGKSKVYASSDFQNVAVSTAVNTSRWIIDNVSATKEGQYSKTPLFQLELKQLITEKDETLPEGYEDASAEMQPNRTYFVREGRPLYNDLLDVYNASDGDSELLREIVTRNYSKKVYRGRVERLNGVAYSVKTRRGTIINRTHMEAWYPESYDEGRIFDDFLYLCNIGVYTPVVNNTPADPIAAALKDVDPSVVAAVVAALGKK